MEINAHVSPFDLANQLAGEDYDVIIEFISELSDCIADKAFDVKLLELAKAYHAEWEDPENPVEVPEDPEADFKEYVQGQFESVAEVISMFKEAFKK